MNLFHFSLIATVIAGLCWTAVNILRIACWIDYWLTRRHESRVDRQRAQYKLRFLRLGLIASVLMLCFGARAQIGATNTAGFFSTAMTWATSFNTNNPAFLTDSLDIWNGASYRSGLNVADELGIDWQAYRFGAGLSLNIGSVTGTAGIDGTILSQSVTVGISKTMYDLRVTGYVGGGYDFDFKHAYIPIGIDLRKAMTAHTFVGLRLEEAIFFKGNAQAPTVTADAGITF